ncbi:MAG: hypothetical protein Q8S73_23345 [Deltaproteobacteria bacterium]|nr:hypothetical protein [Myxococcales bacterium]MDP3217066.1 hypothetical protein [Deltaproteobacteria bacterium]
MNPTDPFTRDLNHLAPLLLLGVVLYVLARKFHWQGGAKVIAQAGLGIVAVLVLFEGVRFLPEHDMGFAIAGWLALGLPVYLVRRWIDTAKARELAGSASHADGRPGPPHRGVS